MSIYKQGLIFIAGILNVIQYAIFPECVSKIVKRVVNKANLFLLNTEIKVHGNTDYLNGNKLIIMANHYEGFIDGNVLNYLFFEYSTNDKLYIVVKDTIFGDPKEQNIFLYLMHYIKNIAMKAFNFIPYKRGDKTDGMVVKNQISEHLQANKTILIFPEGTTRVNGIPLDFKPGIFKLAVEQKVAILPITLKYARDIGSDINTPQDYSKIFDCLVDVYIHEPVYSSAYDDHLVLKEDVFRVIRGALPPDPPLSRGRG
jgi:1-acyl-sn-glycerol-3-phosphate acyltransferase